MSIIVPSESGLGGFAGVFRGITERRAARAALRDSEERFRLLVEGVRDHAIVDLDGEGRVTSWNSGAERITGYRAEEILGREFSVFYQPEDVAAGIPAADLGAATTRGSVETGGWRIRQDGSAYWAQVVITALFDHSHRLRGFAEVTRDVSEGRAAERALRDSEERLRTVAAEARLAAIVECSDDAIWGGSFEGAITSWNRGAERLYGYGAAEMVGRSVLRPEDDGLIAGGWIPKELSDEMAVVVARVARGQVVRHLETRRVCQDGGLVDVSLTVSPVQDASGSLSGMSVVARDITERKRHELVLAVERRRLRAAESVGHMGSWEMDVRTGDVALSDTVVELYGMVASDFDGTYSSMLDCVHPDDRVEVGVAVTGCSSDGGAFRVRYRVSRADTGALRWFDMSGESISVDGRIVRLAGALVDVTELVVAASVVEQARDSALEASRQKSAFLATMSHEIRTPMNAVIGMTGLLLDSDLDDEQREFVDIVRTSGDLLLGIINDILDFSKIEAGGLELENRPFDLRRCVEDALDLLAVAASVKGLELMGYVADRCPIRVIGDVARLRQVLANLLGNAVKFTASGEVVLTVEVDGPQAEEAGGTVRVRFAVTDTGIGIPSDRIHGLFDAFSQVDTSTTRIYGGTGLGLAISQRLVEAMGADLAVESVSGAGSTFFFSVDLERAEDVADVPAPQPPVSLGGLSALVVDDNSTNRRILRLQIEGGDMHVTEAASAEAALGIIDRGERFDVAVASEPRSLPLSAPSGATPSTPVLRVLLVEDNPVNQLVGRRLLQKLGHRVDVAGNGREAIEAVRHLPYDAVLMDIQMPVMDGLEATRTIRADLPINRQPHIVALTASVLVEDRKACNEAGMDDYLAKPVRIEDLSAALRQIAPQHFRM